MTVVKNIFITRHGHADFNAALDFDRVLTNKGLDAVTKTAEFIKIQCKKKLIIPQLCLSSAAIRTKQTADIICLTNKIDNYIFQQELYSTTVSTWIDKLVNLTQDVIVLVGHNPTFSQMVNVLCGYEVYMQPANCAFVTLEIKPDGFVYPAILNDLHNP